MIKQDAGTIHRMY